METSPHILEISTDLESTDVAFCDKDNNSIIPIASSLRAERRTNLQNSQSDQTPQIEISINFTLSPLYENATPFDKDKPLKSISEEAREKIAKLCIVNENVVSGSYENLFEKSDMDLDALSHITDVALFESTKIVIKTTITFDKVTVDEEIVFSTERTPQDNNSAKDPFRDFISFLDLPNILRELGTPLYAYPIIRELFNIAILSTNSDDFDQRSERFLEGIEGANEFLKRQCKTVYEFIWNQHMQKGQT